MSNVTPEKKLIDAFKKLDDVKDLLEQVINELGEQKQNELDQLPEDVQRLVGVAVTLKPEQRKHLMLFLDSLKNTD
jgi:dsDNA-binding SOS-regulon protein